MHRFNTRISFIGISTLILGVMLWSITHAFAAPVITIGATGLAGYQGSPYSAQFSASGGVAPYLYTFTGTLPSGTFFNVVSGQVTGTPTSSGRFPIKVTATDINSDASAQFSFELCIGILISPASLPNITATKPYSGATITADCGQDGADVNTTVDYTYSISGQPTGLTIDSVTGVISGTTNQTGSFTITVSVNDDANPGNVFTRTYNNVTSANPVFTYTPSTLSNGIAAQAYSSNITVSNGTAPYTVTKKGSSLLPAGAIFTTTGTDKFGVSATALQSVALAYHLDVTVTDSKGVTENQVFNFTINAPSLTISPTTLPNGTVGVAYSQQLAAAGGDGNYSFTIAPGTNLPTGVSMTLGGLIDGIPTVAATYIFTVNVNDTSGPVRTGTRVYSLVVVGGASGAYGSVPPVGSTLAFGLVTTPGTDVPVVLTVTNSGTANLSVSVPTSGAVFTGPNAADFRFGGSVQPTFNLAPGASTALIILCRPANTLFASTATMTFRTNDPVRPNVSYPLACNQVVPTATPGVGTPTAISGTSAPSVVVLGQATVVVTNAPSTFATLTFVKGLALRSGPYLGATMLGVLSAKTDYPVLAVNPGDGEGKFNWYLVVDDAHKKIGWASGRYLILKGDPNISYAQTVFDQIANTPDVGVRLTIFGNVNIRARPSERMPVIHITGYGTELQVLGRTQQAGITQWVHVRFFTDAGQPIDGWVYYNFQAPALMKLTGIAPLDAVPIR